MNAPAAADPKFVSRPQGWTLEHDARWARVFARLLKTEGGYVNHRADPGGATKYGISLRFLAIEGLLDIDRDGFSDFDLNRDGQVDAMDVRLLTPANAEALYLRLFFSETGFWSLPRAMDAAVFDLGVNAGTVTAARVLQRTINRFGPPPLATDGVLGPVTRRALDRAMKEGPVLTAFRREAEAYYRLIVSRNGKLSPFLNGWLTRARELGHAL